MEGREKPAAFANENSLGEQRYVAAGILDPYYEYSWYVCESIIWKHLEPFITLFCEESTHFSRLNYLTLDENKNKSIKNPKIFTLAAPKYVCFIFADENTRAIICNSQNI